MKLSDFSYYLPEELIAQTPLTNRSASRLLVVDRKTGAYEDKHFEDILDYFQPGDCLIANDSRVIPARLQAKRPTGGAVEIFLLRPYGEDRWECLVKPGRNAREGQILLLGDLTATVESVTEEGNRVIAFTCAEGDVTDKLKALGEVPLPPYIHEKLADPIFLFLYLLSNLPNSSFTGMLLLSSVTYSHSSSSVCLADPSSGRYHQLY